MDMEASKSMQILQKFSLDTLPNSKYLCHLDRLPCAELQSFCAVLWDELHRRGPAEDVHELKKELLESFDRFTSQAESGWCLGHDVAVLLLERRQGLEGRQGASPQKELNPPAAFGPDLECFGLGGLGTPGNDNSCPSLAPTVLM